MIAALLVLFGAAALTPALVRRGGSPAALGLAVLPGALFVALLTRFPWSPETVLRESAPWIPELGVELSFRVDGLAYVFLLLISGIGTLIVIYASGYFRGKLGAGRLLGWLLFFLASMLGLVAADHLIVMFLFWELTSVSSFMLVGFQHESDAARDAARRAIAVTGAGGLALLAGILLLGIAGRECGLSGADALTLSRLAGVDLTAHALYRPALLLIALGAFTKSAQVPFHFWLPGAMTAPTPVSAFLHSATMVKAGIYLLARLHPVLGGTRDWTVLLVAIGGLTMLTATVLCIGQRDLKRILAYSTVSVLGILTLLLGMGTDYAIKAAVVFLVAHALYKAALFMVAGNVDLATGTRDVTRLGGLFRPLRWTAIAALLAALSQAGAPPLFGFLGKELVYKAKLAPDPSSSALLLLAFLTNVVLVAMALVVAIWPFRGPRTESTRELRPLPATMVLPPLVLAFLGIFIGILPGSFDAGIGSAAATAIAGYPIEMKLKLWHGLNPEALAVLGFSALTLAAGGAIFVALERRLHLTEAVAHRLGRFGAQPAFDGLLAAAAGLGHRLVALLLRGGLRGAIAMILGALVLVTLPALRGAGFPLPVADSGVRPVEAVLLLLILGGGVATVLSRSPLVSLVAMGVSGLGLALLFAAFGAPDLAMTQIMVEVLALLVLLAVMRRVPQPLRGRAPGRVLQIAAALAVGGIVTALTLQVGGSGFPADTAAFYLEQSYPAAQGRNVVNTILVDFRALDTLGEVLVVAAAGLGVLVLLGASRKGGRPS